MDCDRKQREGLGLRLGSIVTARCRVEVALGRAYVGVAYAGWYGTCGMFAQYSLEKNKAI